MKRTVSLERQDNGEIKYELAKPVIRITQGEDNNFQTQIAPVVRKDLRSLIKEAEDGLDNEFERHKKEVEDLKAYIASLKTVYDEISKEEGVI